MHTLDRLLAAREVVLTCGPGGVGKTTTAAALGTMAAVHHGGRVLVVTVDPARRLATALGMDAFGNHEQQVHPDAFTAAGLRARGELWFTMLDTKAAWDDLVARYAPDPRTRRAIVDNQLYHTITARFVQSHEYIAVERLHELHTSGRYDLVVVDTPPSRNALDLLDAPTRMAEFFGGRLVRWLTMPYRNRVLSAASRPFLQVADRVLGAHFLSDIAEFFTLMQTMEAGFVARSREVARILEDRRAAFCVVATPEPGPVAEAVRFVAELGDRRLELGAVILNRCLPAALTSAGPERAAAKLAGASGELTSALQAVTGADPAVIARVLDELARTVADYSVIATREAEQAHELHRIAPAVVRVPLVARPITNLADLAALGAHLWQ
jgi:anion-transporting  ArsA/GET3 family ATPase